MSDFKNKGIYFIPLGGADEIGMNMFAYVVNGKIIVIDAGYGFLNDDYPGMDMCYASPDFLENYKEDILGLFIFIVLIIIFKFNKYLWLYYKLLYLSSVFLFLFFLRNT